MPVDGKPGKRYNRFPTLYVASQRREDEVTFRRRGRFRPRPWLVEPDGKIGLRPSLLCRGESKACEPGLFKVGNRVRPLARTWGGCRDHPNAEGGL
jgi:hypothetical protein